MLLNKGSEFGAVHFAGVRFRVWDPGVDTADGQNPALPIIRNIP